MSLLRTAAVLPRASSLISRTTASVVAARAGHAFRQHARGVHYENSVYHNTPFHYENKKAFTAGYFGLMGTLFSVPFIAVGYQLSKGNGTAH